MSSLKIVLGRYNSTGVFANIENDDDDHLEIHCTTYNGKPPAVCRAAARKLRRLSDAFEILASMEDPMKSKSQDEAMRLVTVADWCGDHKLNEENAR